MLSPKKQKFLDFIKGFSDMNSRPPTFVEIMEGLQFKSLGTINWYIVELEKDGLIERVKGYNGKRALSVFEEKISNTVFTDVENDVISNHMLINYRNISKTEYSNQLKVQIISKFRGVQLCL